MSAAILTQGTTFLRDTVKAAVTHVAISDDTTAFAVGNTGINPGAGTTSTHACAATKADVSTDSEDYTFALDGSAFFTNKVINSISIAKGTAVRQATGSGGTHTVQPSGSTTVGTDAITRSLRASGFGWGIIAGDIVTVGVRLKHEDNS